MEIFCNIIFTVNFDQFNASLQKEVNHLINAFYCNVNTFQYLTKDILFHFCTGNYFNTLLDPHLMLLDDLY